MLQRSVLVRDTYTCLFLRVLTGVLSRALSNMTDHQGTADADLTEQPISV